MGPTKKGLIVMAVFSLFYAVLETALYWDPSLFPSSPVWERTIFTTTVSLYFYRFIYDTLFLFPSWLSSGKLISFWTAWYLIYGSLAEDVFYWILELKIPNSYAWFYPVYRGIPLDDVIAAIFLAITADFSRLRRVGERLHR